MSLYIGNRAEKLAATTAIVTAARRSDKLLDFRAPPMGVHAEILGVRGALAPW